MSALLITGRTGFIGGHLREALAREPVALLGRSRPKLATNERWRYVDPSKPILPEALEGKMSSVT